MSRVVDVPDLVARARSGEPRAVARLISLVEDASPHLRDVAAALAQTHRAGAGRRPHRLARRRQVHDDLAAFTALRRKELRVGVLS
ncbi:hypothetical protein KUTG_06460 [Kutzneria sp. 744]|nr:hypothetical protein KUTG_06460 [Kutzneria sp. 744]